MSDNSAAAQRALRAWANALRGDWGSIDGRQCRGELEVIAAALNDDADQSTYERLCQEAGVCHVDRCWPEHCREATGYSCPHMDEGKFS